MNAQTILDFWFSPQTQAFWFAKSDDFDAKLHQDFYKVWQQAAAGELAHWRQTVQGRLAEILVLDQFSRNLHRDSPLAFACDPMALVLAQEALLQEDFASMTEIERKFTLMPFMHSESLAIHEQALVLFAQYADDYTLEYERKHKVIIDRFGRYPHRNAVLGRESSAQELAFLQEPNSSF